MLGNRVLRVSYIFMLVPPNPCNIVGWCFSPVPLPRNASIFRSVGRNRWFYCEYGS